VNVTVTPVNDAPVAANDTVTTAEDTAVVINVLGNDTDVDGDTLSVTAINGTAITATTPVAITGGTVSLGANGQLTFTPAANFNGTPSFTYTVSDGKGGTSNGTVNVTVTPVNDAPVAAADTVRTDEDTPVVINVLGNDTDVDGDALSITRINGTAITTTTPVAITGGTVSLGANGQLTFTPTANFNGTPSFTYTVSDGKGGTSTGNVNVTVTPVNDAPVNVTPQTLTAGSGVATLLSGISIRDVDAGTSQLTTTVQVGSGVLTVGGVAAGAVVAGSGSGTVTLTGTLDQINASLSNLSLNGGALGQTTLTITTNDGQATDVDVVTVTIARVQSGVAQDGYLAGATVFIDTNGNGKLDPGEDSARTDADGNFKLASNASGNLVVLGGINTDSGLPNHVSMSAPQGASVINPITTLVAQQVNQGKTVEQANADVAKGLGLKAGVDFTKFDLLAPTSDPEVALAGQKAAVQISALMLVAAEVAVGAQAQAAVQAAVVTSLANAIGSGNTLDLTSANSVSSVLTSALVSQGVSVSVIAQATSEVVATATAASNATSLGALTEVSATLIRSTVDVSRLTVSASDVPGLVADASNLFASGVRTLDIIQDTVTLTTPQLQTLIGAGLRFDDSDNVTIVDGTQHTTSANKANEALQVDEDDGGSYDALAFEIAGADVAPSTAQLQDGALASLAESGMLRVYLADNIVVDATSTDKILTTLQQIAEMGVDQVLLDGQAGKPVYVGFGDDVATLGQVQEVLNNLQLTEDGAQSIFSGAEKVALVLKADAADALSKVDGALEQLKVVGITEVDVLLSGDGVAPQFESSALEVKLIGQQDELYDYLSSR